MERLRRDAREPFAGREPDIAEENLQARIRGNLLMALSNKFGWLVLTTGNKTEMAVGYSTLYGDSAGGFAVHQGRVQDAGLPSSPTLAGRARRGAPSRRTVIDPPAVARSSAPISPTRTRCRRTRCSTAILEGYVEDDLGATQIVARGLDREDVERVIRMVDLAEYKRRQNPPGIKITPRRSARTAACRSPTATAAESPRAAGDRARLRGVAFRRP